MNRDEFLNCIEKEESVDIISMLKDEILPLVLWGCGDVADSVWEYLERNNIKVSGVWVDGVQGELYYKGLKIEDLQGVRKEFSTFNVILGHSQYNLGLDLKKKLPFINKVFYLASVHYNQYKNVPYESVEAVADRIVSLISGLKDDESIDCLLAYVNTKVTGNQQYIFDVYHKDSNFFNNDIYKVSGHEKLLDIGAYNGDTIKLFLSETGGEYDKIIALEPDDKSFLELNDYIAFSRLKNIVTSKMGAWNQRKDLKFVTGNEQISSVCLENIEENTVTIYADRIDNIFMEDITLIKINYYSGVLQAIEGCEKVIRKFHPKLAIDVGFDIYNVLDLTEYITSLQEGYQLYLRFNRAMSSTFTLYAVVGE